MISKIRLTDFRNFKNEVFAFSPKTTVLVGPNGAGKTNVLEALFLLSTGKSFRARVEEEMVNYDKGLARVKGKLEGEVLEVVLTRGQIDIGAERPERVPRKKLLVNGVSKRLIDFAGNFKVTLFGPWDLDLVTESPSLRRNFLDAAISQVDRDYRRASLSYEKGLRQRNRLLWQIREFPSLNSGRARLLFWDKLLIKNGDYISEKREEFINFVNGTQSINRQEFQLDYDKSAISEGRLAQYAEEEIAAATTLVGPHRDDFVFKMGERELARFGSRGEQRMSVLWLKLAELAFVEEKSGTRPTLLLDDIFSELDHAHRDVVISIAGKQQTIITTADPHFVETFKRVEKIELFG
jgi:DNA replication and repair protein RecF